MKRYALYWYCFFLVPFFWPGIPMAGAAEDLLALATALFAAAIMWEGRSRAFSEPWAWTFLTLILIPVSIHLGVGDLRSPWFAWRNTMYITASWIVFMMAREHGRTMLVSPAFAWVLTATAYSFIAYALIQAYDVRFFTNGVANRLFPIWSEPVARFPGPMQQPNFQGIFLSLVICSQLFQGLLRPEKLRLWTLLAIVPFAGILLTSSRSSLLAVGLGMACILYIAPHRKTCLMGVASIVAFGTVLSLIIGATAPTPTQDMISRIESGGFATRLVIWDMCIRIALKHALFGIGWGNLPAYGIDGTIEVIRHHPSWSGAATMLGGGSAWAHNILLQGWVEGGIPGLLAVAMLCVAVLKKMLKFYPNPPSLLDGQVLGAILAMMLLYHGMLSVSIMQPFFMSILALSIAATFPRNVEQGSTA